MKEMSLEVGMDSEQFKYAEGWERHSHLGFASEDFDQMFVILGSFII